MIFVTFGVPSGAKHQIISNQIIKNHQIDWGAGNDLDDVASKPAPRRHPDPQKSCDSAPPISLSRPQQRVFAQVLSSEVAAILT